MKLVKVFWKNNNFYDVHEIDRNENIVTIQFSKSINPSYSDSIYFVPDFLITNKKYENIKITKKRNNQVLPTQNLAIEHDKELFLKYIDILKSHQDKLNTFKQGLDVAIDGIFTYSLDSTIIDALIDLLEEKFNDIDQNIAYYVFVLEFGKHQNCIQEKSHINFSSPEALFDSIYYL